MPEAKGYILNLKEPGMIECFFTQAAHSDAEAIAIAQGLKTDTLNLLRDFSPSEALILVELSNEEGIINSTANQYYAELLRDPRIMRMAIFGGQKKYRRVAKLLIPFIALNKIKVFDTKSEAYHWLLSQ